MTGKHVLQALWALGLLFSGCITDPEHELYIQLDSDEYALIEGDKTHSLRITAEVTNRGERTLYLYRWCGATDRPMAWLQRADGDTARADLGGVLCNGEGSRAPVPLSPGDTYVDELHLEGEASPEIDPPISVAERTGLFRLVYVVQRTDAVSSDPGPVDRLPFEETRSPVFRITAPE